MLKKITVEAALNGEMDDHLGYEKHQISDKTIVTAVMAIPVRHFILMMALSTSTCHGIGIALLNHSWSKSSRPD